MVKIMDSINQGKVIDMAEFMPIRDPAKFAEKLQFLIENRNKQIDTITTIIRLKNGSIAISTSGVDNGSALWDMACGTNALINGTSKTLPDIDLDE